MLTSHGIILLSLGIYDFHNFPQLCAVSLPIFSSDRSLSRKASQKMAAGCNLFEHEKNNHGFHCHRWSADTSETA